MQKAICSVFTRLSNTRLHRGKLESQMVTALQQGRDRTYKRDTRLHVCVQQQCKIKGKAHVVRCYMYRGADKSLARPTSRCRRMESIVSLEANLLLRSNNICLLQTLKNLWRDERHLILNKGRPP